MSMSKKDYILIAETLRDRIRACEIIDDLHERLTAQMAVRVTAYAMHELFSSLYVNYNGEKFLAVIAEASK